MISPEAYYHDSIEGRSPEQILWQIHSLKREIRHLIRVLESDELNSELMIAPHPRTQISLKREYLELAVKAYTDAGGKLELNGIEQKEAAFNAHLPGMRKLVLEMRGSERYTVTFPERPWYRKRSCLLLRTGKAYNLSQPAASHFYRRYCYPVNNKVENTLCQGRLFPLGRLMRQSFC